MQEGYNEIERVIKDVTQYGKIRPVRTTDEQTVSGNEKVN